jgi:hypothetical protein
MIIYIIELEQRLVGGTHHHCVKSTLAEYTNYDSAKKHLDILRELERECFAFVCENKNRYTSIRPMSKTSEMWTTVSIKINEILEEVPQTFIRSIRPSVLKLLNIEVIK